MLCMRERRHAHAECRELSKAYLACRMSRNLMAPEDLDTLGFAADAAVVPPPQPPAAGGADGGEGERPKGPVIAGLTAARKAKGGFLGVALPGLGDAGPAPTGRRVGGH